MVGGKIAGVGAVAKQEGLGFQLPLQVGQVGFDHPLHLFRAVGFHLGLAAHGDAVPQQATEIQQRGFLEHLAQQGQVAGGNNAGEKDVQIHPGDKFLHLGVTVVGDQFRLVGQAGNFLADDAGITEYIGAALCHRDFPVTPGQGSQLGPWGHFPHGDRLPVQTGVAEHGPHLFGKGGQGVVVQNQV